jgi:hypothetical protein
MSERFSRPALWLALAGLLVAAFLCFAYPMYVIRPFRAQGTTELAIALVVRRWGPRLAILCAAMSLGAVVGLWRQGSRIVARAGAVALALLTIAFAALSQVNVYELMFHPVPKAGFVAADKAPVEGDDMVLVVSISGEQRAYPIRTMGYHHIVNDRVGGVAIVATY